jgi:hypothetical protein
MGRPRAGHNVMDVTLPVRMPMALVELIDKARQLRAPLVPNRSDIIREWCLEAATREIDESK